ncbi:hypothetical protein XENTR_v10006593 [Xenopus tropicalis]|nr:hypothetical protein XENTR_v10006593 [Xenopus tropicalis]
MRYGPSTHRPIWLLSSELDARTLNALYITVFCPSCCLIITVQMHVAVISVGSLYAVSSHREKTGPIIFLLSVRIVQMAIHDNEQKNK